MPERDGLCIHLLKVQMRGGGEGVGVARGEAMVGVLSS